MAAKPEDGDRSKTGMYASNTERSRPPRISFNPMVFGISANSIQTRPSIPTSTTMTQSDESSSDPMEGKDKLPEILSRFNVSEVLYDDLDDVKRLMSKMSMEVFNIEDPFEVIHKCFISYKLTNFDGKIVAVIAMDEYPNIPAIPKMGWTPWADKLYNIKNVSGYNSMWVHFLAYEKNYEDSFLLPMLNNLFHEYMIKQFVLIIIPANYHDKVPFLEGCSSVVLPQDFTDPMRVQTIRLCVRQDFITQYKIRRAVEEDNDDLVPLIHRFSPRFVQLYGEYYVAEIISRHPEAGRNIIVAEHEGEAVSVLCLNPTVNYKQLNECFNLHVFTGLYKTETAEQIQAQKTSAHAGFQKEVASRAISTHEEELDFLTNYFGMSMRQLSPEQDEPEAPKSDHTTINNDELAFAILDDLDNLSTERSSSSIILTTMSRAHMSDAFLSDEISMESVESTPTELPFTGVENAFAIEILAAQPTHVPSLALLIVSCFECFPTRDYCLLMMPHGADYTPMLKYFVRVQSKLNAQHPHDLYVCHRGQLSPILVQTAGEDDTEKITNFLALVKHPNSQVEVKANFLKGISGENDIQTFLAYSGKKNRYVVGLTQVARVRDLNSIKLKYAVNRRSDIARDNNSSFGYLASFIMSPLFKGHIKYFLRDIHRKTNFGTLFYALNQYDSMDYRIRPMSFAMQDMWLVAPRKIRVSLKKPLADYPEEPYALFVSTPKLMSKQVVEVNYRIVVIGASETALSFLEALLTTQVTQCLVTFNNVLLVSTDGLWKHEKSHHVRDMLLATHSLRDSVYHEKTALRSMISILAGNLTSIDRKNQTIRINNKIVVPYDYLFLMTGLQYGPPKKMRQQEYVRTKLPINCFAINTEKGADLALKQLKSLVQNAGDNYEIVVYGHSIDCYCCIAALLEFGIPSKSIMFIDPWPRDKDPPVNHEFIFQDGGIYETVVNMLTEKYHIDIRTGFKLIDWSSKPLTLRFESLTRYLVLTPLCAFLYSDKEIDVNLFNVITESGLVFDGRLVVDPDCHTNDKHIYAAGSNTKYSRKLWADHLSHKYFNSSEIGARLGGIIRALVLPFKERESKKYTFGEVCDSQYRHHVPRYVKPLITYCKLPGGLYYLNVVKPGVQIPLETAMSDSDYGTIYTTGNPKNLKLQGYFRIHLNNLRTVETITCLSTQKFDYRKLVLIWGKHEALLNNLVRQFELISITDFFEYFQSAWCAAIFHDDFPLLENAIMKVMTSATSIPGDSPMEDLCRMYAENGFQPLSVEQRKIINDKFADSEFESKIQSLIVDFIRDNLGILDMYAHPVVVNYILSGYKQSPLFKTA